MRSSTLNLSVPVVCLAKCKTQVVFFKHRIFH
jgi:hypothetical protein